jgi:hypothetical protein
MRSMRCLPPPWVLEASFFFSCFLCNSHPVLAGTGDGSGDDSGDEGERPGKQDDEDEDEEDVGTVDSPVRFCQLHCRVDTSRFLTD